MTVYLLFRARFNPDRWVEYDLVSVHATEAGVSGACPADARVLRSTRDILGDTPRDEGGNMMDGDYLIEAVEVMP